MAITETFSVDGLVSVERGEIDRRIFSDPDIFDAEMELIFGRAWQFLCHESQIAKAGDFVETPMGLDNVLAVRQKDGTIRGLLNTCTHRGNAVCRADEGNTKAFMCTYHGWSYDLGGNLIGVPGIDLFYKGDLDMSQHGLRQVAQLESYHGFVFATLDPTAPPLTEYLGPTGRLGIDLIAMRGDMEAIPGIQKFLIDCNWKFAVDNLFDWYHPQVTHMSAVASGIIPPDLETKIDAGGARNTQGDALDIPAGLGGSGVDEITFVAEYGHAIGGPSAKGQGDAGGLIDTSWREKPEVLEALGPVGAIVAGHPNIFPNSWIATGTAQLSLRIPRGPNQTEIWWYSFTNKDNSPERRAVDVMVANHIFGPAGLLEQEDGENWSQSTMQTRGMASRRIPQLLRMDLGRGKMLRDEQGRCRMEGTTNEHAQLWTYAAWAEWMKGSDWDTLRENTTPGDFM
jgi:phenylpropionate dioxygenase-like ring-hydroxylating dioxygenase large terminal subunit